MSTKSLGLVLMLAAFGLPVLAQPAYVPIEQRLTAEQLQATGLHTLSAAQLQLLNTLLSEQKAQVSAASVSAVASPTAAAPAKTSAMATDTAPPAAANRPLLGFNEDPIVSRLQGTINGWDEGTVFVLANGQQWKVLKGRVELPKPVIDPQVKVVPGIAGRWFLQVSEDYPMARVYLLN